MKNSISIKAILRKDKKRKDNTIPICIQVIVGGEKMPVFALEFNGNYCEINYMAFIAGEQKLSGKYELKGNKIYVDLNDLINLNPDNSITGVC